MTRVLHHMGNHANHRVWQTLNLHLFALNILAIVGASIIGIVLGQKHQGGVQLKCQTNLGPRRHELGGGCYPQRREKLYAATDQIWDWSAAFLGGKNDLKVSFSNGAARIGSKRSRVSMKPLGVMVQSYSRRTPEGICNNNFCLWEPRECPEEIEQNTS